MADGSVVPANLGVNPSLTITALAEYVVAGISTNPRGSFAEPPLPAVPGAAKHEATS